MKIHIFLCSLFFALKVFSETNTQSSYLEAKEVEVKSILSQIDFLQDIPELPKEIVLWTLEGDSVIKKFSNVTFRWTIMSPHSLFLPEIDLLSDKETYKLVKKYAQVLYVKKDGTQRSFHHTPIRYENPCLRNPSRDMRPSYSQHWIWVFNRSSGPDGDYSFILTATASTETCLEIESKKPVCERYIWISNDMIDKMVSRLSLMSNCGDRLGKQFKLKTPSGHPFNVQSIASHIRYLIRESEEEKKREAKEECGCYDILPCLFNDEAPFCLNDERTEKNAIDIALKVLFEENC